MNPDGIELYKSKPMNTNELLILTPEPEIDWLIISNVLKGTLIQLTKPVQSL